MPPISDSGADLAREYLRVSQDRSGRLQSPAEQHADNQRAAQSNRWRLGEPYAETEAVSASRYASKTRAAFDRLCADIDSGMFGARVLILWESSRGSRKVGEWVDLIESCESAGVLVHVTTHGRTYDPANARDRRSLLEDAVDYEYESGKTSARLRRAFAAASEEGRPGGRVPYGYERLYDPLTRRLVKQQPHPDEAPVIAELYERLRAGHSLKAIARDFAGRGIVTRGSKRHPPQPFAAQYLRNLALRPCYAGLRVHQPVGGPRRPGATTGAVEAIWPPLTDRETWHAVHAMLTDPARRTSRPGRARHLLSLIARCDECGELLRAYYRRHGQRHDQGDEVRDYSCRGRGCVRISADALDEYATATMLEYLARPDVFEQLRAGSADPAALTAVRGQLEAALTELRDWRDRARRLEITAASFAAVEPAIVARIDQLEEQERQLITPPELAGLVKPRASVAAWWAETPLPARRQVARLLCSPGILGTLKVGPSPRRGPTPQVSASERVTWDRRQSPGRWRQSSE